MLKLKEYIPNASVSIYIGREFSGGADFTIIECPNIGKYGNHISVFTAGKLYDEINNDGVKFDQFSMLVLDECHHTVKKHAYAKLMKLYLHEKLSENQQPSPLNLQILGLTASLGAGGSSDIAGHLKDLAAHLDATGGIVSVKNPSDVEKYSKNKSRKLEVLQPRDITSDPFYLEINGVMSEIEKDVNIFKGSKYPRWSQQYETHVNQVKMSLMTASEKNEFFNQIASLSELKLYCNALMVYMDLRSSDAIKIIVESLGISENQTCHEISLNKMKDTLLSKLNELSDTENENSLLQGMESVLCRKFKEKVSSRGIIFVRTQYHTLAMKEWIESCNSLRELGVVPDAITGHSRKESDMTLARQREVLTKFKEGIVNILIATSVAEEGLDIPECNLVIRYQHVSSEIAKEQGEGRARDDNSDCYTIVSSLTNLKSQEIKNERLILQVTDLIKKSSAFTEENLSSELHMLQL